MATNGHVSALVLIGVDDTIYMTQFTLLQQETLGAVPADPPCNPADGRRLETFVRHGKCCSLRLDLDPTNLVGVYKDDGHRRPATSHGDSYLECELHGPATEGTLPDRLHK